ncbi:MAG: ATP-binding cassette domain-containing protein [Eggerthellaceae bacterium]|nr:ATP-binding cassette domain-containing protein [Eggerthellaceae bacterium]
MTIEFRNVHASYDASTPILKGVNFTVSDGEFVAFVGTNGAGKSTTMRLVNGLLKPEQGEVLIDGVPTTQLKTSELARRVGFLFQNPDSQICCNTVREELLFGFRALKMDMARAERRVDDIIDEFGFNPDDDPFLLNRGTRQLLALASIVVLETPAVVLDEPTTGLDFRECVKVMGIIRRLHERGTTVVMVCHDMEVVADFADRVIVMSDGRVVDQGPTFEVLRNRHTLEVASLVPPQIVDISLGLSIMRPELAGTLVGTANTLNEMETAVASAVGKPDRSQAAPTYAQSAPGAEDAAGIGGTQVGVAEFVRIPTSPIDPAGVQLNELLDAQYEGGETSAESPAVNGPNASAADDSLADVALGAGSSHAGSDAPFDLYNDRPAPEPVGAIGFAVPGTVSESGRNLVVPEIDVTAAEPDEGASDANSDEGVSADDTPIAPSEGGAR